METWQILVGLTGMLLIYAVIATVMGVETTALDVVVAVVFGALGLYLGGVLTNRLNSGEK